MIRLSANVSNFTIPNTVRKYPHKLYEYLHSTILSHFCPYFLIPAKDII